MSDQIQSTDGASERDSEGARSRPLGETTATDRREAQHLLQAVGHFDLGSEATSLITEAHGSQTGRSSKTLVKIPHLRLTLTAVRAGTRIEEHQAHAPAALIGLIGSLRFMAGGQTLQLEPQQVVSLESEVRHSIEASEDGAFLMVLGWSSQASEAAEASHQRARP